MVTRAERRRRITGRSESASFLNIPHQCLRHENFISLSPKAIKLLIDLLLQYRGKNNGDLSCTWKIMKERGWNSKATLSEARKELLEKGWIILTRQGDRNLCSLYAVSFRAIDECGDKLDISPTITAPNTWKKIS